MSEVDIIPYRLEFREQVIDLVISAWEPVFAKTINDVPRFVYDNFWPQGWQTRQVSEVSSLLDADPEPFGTTLEAIASMLHWAVSVAVLSECRGRKQKRRVANDETSPEATNGGLTSEDIMNQARFRMGRLDHVHIRVPDREEAAQWYADFLGFEVVEKYKFWAKGFEGGPLQISADGGKTMLALFEASDGHPLAPQIAGIAFSLDAESFMNFARSLPNGINSPSGQPLQIDDVVDLDLCWAYNFADPWGNIFELNCYEYDDIKGNLIKADGVQAVRYWPHSAYEQYKE